MGELGLLGLEKKMRVSCVASTPPGRMTDYEPDENLIYVTAIDSREIEGRCEMEVRLHGGEFLSLATDPHPTTFAVTMSEFSKLGKPNVGDILMVKMEVLGEGV